MGCFRVWLEAADERQWRVDIRGSSFASAIGSFDETHFVTAKSPRTAVLSAASKKLNVPARKWMQGDDNGSVRETIDNGTYKYEFDVSVTNKYGDPGSQRVSITVTPNSPIGQLKSLIHKAVQLGWDMDEVIVGLATSIRHNSGRRIKAGPGLYMVWGGAGNNRREGLVKASSERDAKGKAAKEFFDGADIRWNAAANTAYGPGWDAWGPGDKHFVMVPTGFQSVKEASAWLKDAVNDLGQDEWSRLFQRFGRM